MVSIIHERLAESQARYHLFEEKYGNKLAEVAVVFTSWRYNPTRPSHVLIRGESVPFEEVQSAYAFALVKSLEEQQNEARGQWLNDFFTDLYQALGKNQTIFLISKPST